MDMVRRILIIAALALTPSQSLAYEGQVDGEHVNVKTFGASGSNTTTTGTISAGSTTLTLTNAIDFALGQGIRINHAGPAYALSPPTVLAVSNIGTPGSTAYTYTISCFDGAGGIDAALTNVSTATGNATLDTTNMNQVTWVAPTGTTPAGCAIWGRAAGAMTLLALLPGNITTWNDKGYAIVSSADWLGSAPPAAQASDWLVTTVSSGAGTTTLTLAASAITTATAQTVLHNDTAAIQAAINSLSPAGGTVLMPTGTYYVHNVIDIGAFPLKLVGAGWGSTIINPVSPNRDVIRQALGSNGLTSISDFAVNSDYFHTGACGFDYAAGPYSSADRIHTFGLFKAFCFANNGVRITNADIRNSTPIYGVGLSLTGSADQYFDNVIIDTSIVAQPKACVEVTQNAGLWISNSDFINCGTGLLIDPSGTNSVKWLFIENTAFDTNDNDGIYINPGASASVVGVFFTNSWSASNGGHGVHLGSTGTIGEINFSSHRSQNNQKHGYYIEGGEVMLSNAFGTQNSMAGSGQYDGVAVTNATTVDIIGGRFGQTVGIGLNWQKYGIELMAGGTVANAHVVDNNVINNVTAGLHFAGTISGQTQMLGNVPSSGEINVNFGGTFQGGKAAANIHSAIGAVPTPTGTCAIDTQTGGMTSGTFRANGACVGGTVILTFASTIAHGFSCTAHNIAAPTSLMNQIAYTNGSVTFSGSMADNDVVTFSCMGF